MMVILQIPGDCVPQVSHWCRLDIDKKKIMDADSDGKAKQDYSNVLGRVTMQLRDAINDYHCRKTMKTVSFALVWLRSASLHYGHLEVDKMKKYARTAVRWLGMDKSISDLSTTCLSCQEHARTPNAEYFSLVRISGSMGRMHIDFAGL